MRKELCTALTQISTDQNMVFFTGDLGFMALEPLQAAMGTRFINAGVAEQNMMSVAAAFARDRWNVWCYSIASFCVMRPFEMIRNDICLHNLPVKLIGNGGGYGYGVMGPTHHAVEDYGVLLTLPNMHVYVPCFDEDVAAVIAHANQHNSPSYIRLGRGERPADCVAPAYAPWRQLVQGDNGIVIATGPIAGMVWQYCHTIPVARRPDVWVVSELPLDAHPIPEAVWARMGSGMPVVVVEEHVTHGGLGQMIAYAATIRGIHMPHFHLMSAPGLALGVYGSQAFLRRHSGLTADTLLAHLGVHDEH
ncbi:MAG: hypothetical protein RL076_471 [Chloroflexota bacterium]|jgi:transketolase